MLRSPCLAVAAIFVAGERVDAGTGADVLIAQGSPILGYRYGGERWDNFSAALDAAAGSVTLTGNLDDLGLMLQYDALCVEQRWTTGTLSSVEVSNISAFIATGRRVLMFGENNGWTNWNNQILGIAGGSYVPGSSFNDVLPPAISHELTAGVSMVRFIEDGIAVGGTPLFAVYNVATLWGANENVLTVLSVGAFSDDEWAQWSNATFSTNVANWIAAPIPSPAALHLLAVGVMSGRRRR